MGGSNLSRLLMYYSYVLQYYSRVLIGEFKSFTA